MSKKKRFELVLGSAFWGWKIKKDTAFKLLERMYASGNRFVDAGTNYPMNANPPDFRLGEKILSEFIKTHGVSDFKIIMKIGSITNARSTQFNLSKSFMLMMAEEYLRMFDSNLESIMIHWDPREEDEAIQQSIEALEKIKLDYNLRPGLSGISFPEKYSALSVGKEMNYIFEGKHNPFYTDVKRYNLSPEENDFFVYGVNAGGLKLNGDYNENSTIIKRGTNPETFAIQLSKIQKKLPDWNTQYVRRPITAMNQLGLIHAYNYPNVSGVILGPSSLSQLNQSLDFVRDLELYDYSDVSEFLISKL